MVLDFLLDPLLGPLLLLPPWLGILIIASVISVLVTVAYKYLTDQERMRTLKAEMKQLQQDMKRFKDDPKKLMEVQSKLMPKNLEYMRHSFRPTLFTMIPIIIIFGWLNAHFAYLPIGPGDVFEVRAIFSDGLEGDVTLSSSPPLRNESPLTVPLVEEDGVSVATWKLAGDVGEYSLKVKFGSGAFFEEHGAEVVISEGREYAPPRVKVKGSVLREIQIGYEPVKPLGSVSLFGWRPGWLGTYILFSLVLSLVLRKLLRVS
ncbi:DUF106 domain-containing protein [Candidatus Woesearchaeota archaeon]|nr:MAG: DUF106 domain-containing protein [Candidatus Woesearchaeota archaeon]